MGRVKNGREGKDGAREKKNIVETERKIRREEPRPLMRERREEWRKENLGRKRCRGRREGTGMRDEDGKGKGKRKRSKLKEVKN